MMTGTQLILALSEVLNSSSSGTGNSYYSCPCPRKAKLDPQYPEAPGFELQVGLIFHKLMELWRTNELSMLALPSSETASDGDAIMEAMRIFKAYTSYYGTSEGKPADFELISAEHFVEDRISWAVPFTMRTDAVVSPKNIDDCKALRGLELEEGAYYLLDYKTTASKASDQCIKDELSTQFKAYIHTWNKWAPMGTKVKGLIVDRIIRYKRDMMKEDSVTGRPKGLDSVLIKPPTDQEVEAINNFYSWKDEFLRTNYCNLEACSYPRVCRHYPSGACDRISR